ncbi:MAG: MarR family transcriptional regulator [Asticcacaulis sp.]|uniref:MarR family transcriptional regulator n=1 Tax=Asticcacaulis sp. TaxID=1872648 RepID=UPI003F7B6DEF
MTACAGRSAAPCRSRSVLSKVTGIEKSSVVLFLDALEKDGWVERRPHPGDRRAHRCI